ncbi:hypothetical protein [Motilimonas pumila]|uniref:Uncharacterized protein n=1 Tax=Motilimonas pumila TaxID=2303987 RepID=A0A418YCW1_9GAMM|nr:hypothetical protein [Motilimonas pumila]RJG42321.1 hypothetical protein D1Z90_13665 [Motilimonas pumila]
MLTSEQLAPTSLANLSQQFISQPGLKLMGLAITQKANRPQLQAIYIEKEQVSQELPFRAQLTIGAWDDTDDSEEFFIEALTATRLVEKLTHFINQADFVFFAVPPSLTIDVVNMYPDQMIHTVFPELGEYCHSLSKEEITAARQGATTIISRLRARLPKVI